MNKEYGEGYAAQRAGKHWSDYPYPRGTPEFVNWMTGWHDAEEEDIEDALPRS